MQSAPKPQNEQERLESLHELNILDATQDRSLDELTELASELCETPVSLVTLIDDQRQFFKSRKGLDVIETPREISFCAHAILEDDLMIVPDTHQDPRFFDNPLVTGPYQVRFYAGFPLSTEASRNLGTLCVVDMKPRKLTAFQIRALQILGHQAAQHLELLRYLKRLDARNRDLRAIMQNISQGIFTLNKEGLTQSEVSAQLPQIMGLPSVAARLKWDQVFERADLTPSQKNKIQETLNQVFQGEAPVEALQQLPDEIRVDQQRIVEVKWDPIQSEDRKLDKVLVALKDVTQSRQNLEQRMILSEKMATIGELVYDLSHELRNAQHAASFDCDQEKQRFGHLFAACSMSEAWKILEKKAFATQELFASNAQDLNTVMRDKNLPSGQKKFIMGLLSLGLTRQEAEGLNQKFAVLPADHQQTVQSLMGTFETFVYMWKSAQRTAEITQSVLDHARTHELKAPVAVTELVDSSLTLLRKKSRALGVTIDLKVQPESTVVVNKSEINQVLLNLIKNALEAFESSKVPVQDRVLSIRQSAAEGALLLTVEDNAGGISPDVLARIFERRFSTKGEKGNGLGLYMAQKLILRNAAVLNVTSRDGKTCFTLRFPTTETMPKAG
ncbi:MAG TPA: ATP-binding protein [Oligoflexus sp.]|uniref:GAF domain-containing sensor histidine kinase n=1 Tax=Oligoflexus sp. TaxID=1971216 RepID=UPI002D808FD1|nr:ATP-binding protein [Oligoflexus sp.]HET9236165.1 ATP-binding protein [Oligoflexus sp.]